MLIFAMKLLLAIMVCHMQNFSNINNLSQFKNYISFFLMLFILVYEETGVYISNIYVVIKVKNNFFKATYVELIFLLIFYSRKFSLSLYQNVSNSGENECLLLVEMFRIFLSSIIDNTVICVQSVPNIQQKITRFTLFPRSWVLGQDMWDNLCLLLY